MKITERVIKKTFSTSQRTNCFCVVKTNRLVLVRKIRYHVFKDVLFYFLFLEPKLIESFLNIKFQLQSKQTESQLQ